MKNTNPQITIDHPFVQKIVEKMWGGSGIGMSPKEKRDSKYFHIVENFLNMHMAKFRFEELPLHINEEKSSDPNRVSIQLISDATVTRLRLAEGI
jgi:hypothetical protein